MTGSQTKGWSLLPGIPDLWTSPTGVTLLQMLGSDFAKKGLCSCCLFPPEGQVSVFCVIAQVHTAVSLLYPPGNPQLGSKGSELKGPSEKPMQGKRGLQSMGGLGCRLSTGSLASGRVADWVKLVCRHILFSS